MKSSEASKKLEFHSKQICHGCVHPSMVGWCENYCQLPEAFKMAIAALEKQEQDRWISVKDGLPENKKKVLVSYDTEDGKKVDISMFDRYGCLLGLVDAWMPLPEPYTEEES